MESTIESPKAYLQFLSQLEVVPCRDDLAKLAEKHLRLTGRAAEIGVNKGIFAQKNLGVWSGEYWAIDAWSIGSNTVNLADPAHPPRRPRASLSPRAHHHFLEVPRRAPPA